MFVCLFVCLIVCLFVYIILRAQQAKLHDVGGAEGDLPVWSEDLILLLSAWCALQFGGYVCMSVCLFDCLFVCLLVCLFICLFFCNASDQLGANRLLFIVGRCHHHFTELVEVHGS